MHVHGDSTGEADHANGRLPPAPLSVLVLSPGRLDPPAREVLAAAPDVRLVDQARATPRESRESARHPDVVLTDVDARDDAAEAVVADLARKWRPVPLLVLTCSEDAARNRRLVGAGARGVVTHANRSRHLVPALHRLRDGEIWLARSCMRQLIDDLVVAGHPAPPHLTTADGLEVLTEREREVVELIARGMHNKAIAAELGITDHTVRHHLTAIYAKLGVGDRLELAVYAFRHAVGGKKA